jgi:hypothetical protein
VIRTSNAFVIDPPVGKRCEAMAALLGDKPVPRLRLAGPERQAEHHELLAQELDRLDRLLLGQLAGHCHRMPVATQQLAGGSARSNPRQNFIFRLPHGAHPTQWNSSLLNAPAQVNPTAFCDRPCSSRSWRTNFDKVECHRRA